MADEHLGGIAAALELALEELEAEVAAMNRAGAAAFSEGDYDGAREALKRAERLDYREGVAALRK